VGAPTPCAFFAALWIAVKFHGNMGYAPSVLDLAKWCNPDDVDAARPDGVAVTPAVSALAASILLCERRQWEAMGFSLWTNSVETAAQGYLQHPEHATAHPMLGKAVAFLGEHAVLWDRDVLAVGPHVSDPSFAAAGVAAAALALGQVLVAVHSAPYVEADEARAVDALCVLVQGETPLARCAACIGRGLAEAAHLPDPMSIHDKYRAQGVEVGRMLVCAFKACKAIDS
jgi:hypothetical protein